MDIGELLSFKVRQQFISETLLKPLNFPLARIDTKTTA